MKIFILDNDETRLDDFLRALTGHGHSLTICRSFPEAVRRHPIDAPYDLSLLEFHYDSPKNEDGEDFVEWYPTWLAPNPPPKIVVHTVFQSGWLKMASELITKGYNPTWMPYGRTLIDYLEAIARMKETRH